MTIEATPSEIAFSGDGSSKNFAIPFPFDTDADIAVFSTDLITGVATRLTTGFSISGGNGSTGGVFFFIAPSAGTKITFVDDPAQTQTTDYVNLDAFPEESHERALDRVTRLCKRLHQQVARTLRFPDGDLDPVGLLPAISQRKSKQLIFDENGELALGALVAGTVTGDLIVSLLTQDLIGGVIRPATAAEITAGVSIVNHAYPVGHVYRYGTNLVPGTTDMSAALTAATSIVGAQVQLPPETMLINSNVGIPVCGSVVGSGWANSIIQCGSAVTKLFNVTQNGGTVPCTWFQGFRINGNSTENALGMVFGDGALTSQVTLKDLIIGGFTGKNAAGEKWDQIVTLHRFNVIVQGCTNDVITGVTAGLPTTVHTWGGWLQTAVFRGDTTGSGNAAVLKSGNGICFHGTVMENNSQGGILAQCASGCTLVDVMIDQQSWFEGNWVNHIDTGTLVFDVTVDGTNGATNLIAHDCHFSHGVSAAHDMRSIGLTHASAQLSNLRCQFGFPSEIVLSTSDCFVVLGPDGADRMGRMISNLNAATVIAPYYAAVFDKGDGTSVLPVLEKITSVTYSASMTFDASASDEFVISASNNTAFTINAPTGAYIGRRITVTIRNTTGGALGAATWNSVFKIASWTQPGTTTSRSIDFRFDGSNWVEVSRTPADVPN